MLSVIALLLGMTGCSKEPSINVQELEKSLVGVWWDEYEYKDVTEDGIPFSRVLLAVKADADHTGCIYLGVFDETSDYPLAIYGGPAVAGFTWKLLGNGSLELGVPTTVKSITITRGDDGSYGDTMTDVSGISMTYTGNALTMNNGTYSSTLTKADAEKQADIEDKVSGEVRPLSTATASDYGKVVCDKGHLHPAKTAVPDGCTAVGILGKVSSTGHGLILALQDAAWQTWNTINGWPSVTTFASTTLKQLPEEALGSLKIYTFLMPTLSDPIPMSSWCVAQKDVYSAIFQNLGSTKYDGGYTYDANVNAYITTGVGGTAMAAFYWSATEDDDYVAWVFDSGYWHIYFKTNSGSVRPVLAF